MGDQINVTRDAEGSIKRIAIKATGFYTDEQVRQIRQCLAELQRLSSSGEAHITEKKVPETN
jgi:hypothetical protein